MKIMNSLESLYKNPSFLSVLCTFTGRGEVRRYFAGFRKECLEIVKFLLCLPNILLVGRNLVRSS